MPGVEVEPVIDMPIATGVSLGGIIVGTGLTITPLGLLSADAVGAPSDATTVILQQLTDTAISSHKAVVSTGTNNVGIADSTNVLHAGAILGVTITATSNPGELADVQTEGPLVEGSWSWVPKKAIFFSDTGGLTQTPPSSGFIQAIGYAMSATKIFIRVEQPTLLS